HARVLALASGIDVPTLWELANDAGSTQSDVALAELALGAASGEARAALVVALVRDAIHFLRRGDRWEPREAASIEAIRSQRAREGRTAATRARILAAIADAARSGVFAPSGEPEERRYLEALEEVTLGEAECSAAARDLALEALQASGLRFDRVD